MKIDKNTKFFLVTDPTKDSTLEDVCSEIKGLPGLLLQVKGGLDVEKENATIYDNKNEAITDAKKRLEKVLDKTSAELLSIARILVEANQEVLAKEVLALINDVDNSDDFDDADDEREPLDTGDPEDEDDEEVEEEKKYLDQVHIATISGDKVRDDEDVEFALGGHHYRYDFIPEDEIWLEDTTEEGEDLLANIIHEFVERLLMKNLDIDYEQAHQLAATLEKDFREYFVQHFSEEAEELEEEEESTEEEPENE